MNQSKCPHCGSQLGNYYYADACPYCRKELTHNTRPLTAPKAKSLPSHAWPVQSFRRLMRLMES